MSRPSPAVVAGPDLGELPSLRPVVVPLSGLLVAIFVSGLSGTIVATSIPTIMRTLDGPASHATWLVAATILANTASTPIWGKLGDSFNPKRVVQAAIAIFVVGSVLASLAQNTTQLIGARALQGIGLGGLTSLILVVVASLVGPRQRGRVNSWLTSVQTTATIAGPVVGGLIVQTPGLGWRWCFLAGVPFAVVSIVVIAATLHLHRPRDAVSSRRGPSSLNLLRQRTPLLCVVAAFCVGSTLFGGTVFISQYLQFGLGLEPAMAGVMLVPTAFGTVTTAYLAGRFMSRTGQVKPVLLAGVALLLAGNIVLTLVDLAPIALALVGTVMVGSALGALTQNLVLSAQNTVPLEHVGAVSSTVMFFFTLGGTVGLVAFGAVLATHVTALEAAGATSGDAYLQGVPWVFALAAGAALPAIAAVLALPGTPLRSSL